MNTVIRARAPLRLGLAGGGTDVAPFCDLYGGAVLNATIDRYAYAIVRTLDEPEVRFVAADRQQSCRLALDPAFPLDGTLDLHKATYNAVVRLFNGGKPLAIELMSFCDAPIGSGLGSSSTVVVTMLKALCELLNVPLDDYALALLAFRIEREDCRLQGGKQDQYAAAFGGFNFMEFQADHRTIVNSLRIKPWVICELEASLLLFFTGVSRESANIIAEQSSNVSGRRVDAVEAMHALKEEAVRMKECVLTADFDGFVGSMRMGWENKKKTAVQVSNDHMNRIYEAALRAGALAGKVSGAGGGGFMLFFAPPERRLEVVRCLEQFDGIISNCHFTETGAQAWKVA